MNLLPTNHPTVLRRLVRELNSQVDGFYTSGHRYHRARLRAGELQVKAHGQPWRMTGYENYFTDAYARHLCASRQSL